MELRHLRYFLAVAETAHFRRAAEALDVSQPTLSLQIQQLERELGTTLFDRIGRRVRLTQAGEVFRDHARRAIQVLDEGRTALNEMDGLLRGRLTIGAVQTVASYLLPKVTARFTRDHPGVRIQVEELSAGAIEAGVVDGRLDLGISFSAGGDEVQTRSLFTESLVLIIPETHRWESRSRIAFGELAGEPLSLLHRGFNTREMVDQAFRTAGVVPSIAVEMNSINAIVATVLAGGPAAILPRLAITGTRLQAIDLERPSLKRRVALLTRHGAAPLRSREAFTAAIAAAMQKWEGP